MSRLTATTRPAIPTRLWLAGFAVLALMIVLPFVVHAQIAGTTNAGTAAAVNAGVLPPSTLNPKVDTGGFSGTMSWLLSGAQHIMAEAIKIFFNCIGFVLLLEVKILIVVSEYSNFVAPGPTAVQIGWQVTRDLANMFFIVILLVIAFATIIGGAAEKYSYKSLLPRLLITAVIINFTKTIVGVLIDLSQVVMLTFVNGYAQAAGGNFLKAFQIEKLLSLSNGVADTPGLIMGLILALIMALVAAAVVLVLIVHLVARIVELWILTIMAPLAFLSSTIPGVADSMYKDWWGRFKKLLVGGPMIAFFIWLALITAQQSGGNIAQGDGFNAAAGAVADQQSQQSATTYGIPTEAAKWDTILSMIIFIAILLAGLKQAQESGLAGAGFAKKVQGGLDGIKKWAWRESGQRAGGATLRGGGAAGRWLGERGVPLAGTFGRYATLQGQKIQKERKEAIEKFSGKPEDIARLSPNAFKRMARKAKGKEADIMAQVVVKDKQLQKSLRADAEIAKKDADLRTANAIATREKDLGRTLTDKEKAPLIVTPKSTLHKLAENLDLAKKQNANDGGELKNIQGEFWQQLTAAGSEARKKALAKVTAADMKTEDIITAGTDLPSGKARELFESANPEHTAALIDVLQKNKNLGTAEKVTKQLREWNVKEAEIPTAMFTVPGVAEYAFEASAGKESRGKIMSNDITRVEVQKVAKQRFEHTLRTGTNDDELVKAHNALIGVGDIKSIDDAFNGTEGDKLRKAIARRYTPGDVSKSASTMTQEQLEAHRKASGIAMEADHKKEEKWRTNDYFDALLPPKAPTQADTSGPGTD